MNSLADLLIGYGIDRALSDLAGRAVDDCTEVWSRIELIKTHNYLKTLQAFNAAGVTDADLYGTTGYGYSDSGREKLEAIFARVFGAEDAIVRPQFVSGTHAISCTLFALLRPGDEFVFATGSPYDTLKTVIGADGSGAVGNLCGQGVKYSELPLTDDGRVDEGLLSSALARAPRVCMFQRSRGYSSRPSLDIESLRRLISIVKRVSPSTVVVVDNCYGEFAETSEPPTVGADVAVGSLIKNPGGGLAPSGGYVVGRRDLIDAVAARLIAPGIGRECGPTLGTNRQYLQGIFLAPAVTAEAMKGAAFVARLAELIGFSASPAYDAKRVDIVQQLRFHGPEQLVSFCKGIQSSGPVNSSFMPEPGPMPGYDDPIIMASPSFIQGSSIEVSCDAPLRAPYCAYFQGGMYCQHAIVSAVVGFQRMISDGNLQIRED